MSILTPMLDRDDNLGLGTPDFFSSAWNPDQNEFLFGEAFRSGVDDYGPYAPPRQAQAENNHVDYFANQLDNLFANRVTSQSGYQFGNTQTNDDLDRILGASETPLVEKSAGMSQPNAGFDPLLRNSQILRIQNSDGSVIANSFTTQTADWMQKAGAHPNPAKLVTKFGNGTERSTSIRFGQITPVDSPAGDASSATRKYPKMSASKCKLEESVEPEAVPKAKKLRKSKKKPLTSEQEEARRMKFLERNRVAADKCRQNRKRWIDDLQSRAHLLGADNLVKKAQVEELEQEIVQLKSLLFIHSRQCDEPDVSEWVVEESNRVQIRGRLSFGMSIDDALSTFGRGNEDELLTMSRPSSSHGFGSVGDVETRRHSTATEGDEFFSVTSEDRSEKSSRRPSVF